MKKTFLVCVAALLLSVACQRTPEIPVVVQKDQEAMIDKAAATSEQAVSAVTQHYKFDLTDDNLTVHVDAPIIVPNADLPVLRVAEKGFAPETIKSLFDYVFQGEAAYIQEDRQQTKQEIEKDLQRMYKELEEGTYTKYDFTEEEYREAIAMIEEMYNNAPEQTADNGPKEADGTMEQETRKMGTIDSLNCYSDSFRLSVGSDPTSKDDYGSSLSLYSVGGHYPPYSNLNLKPIDQSTPLPEALTITFEQAVAMADAYVEAIGEPFSLHSAFLIDDEQDGHVDDLVQPAESYAYQLLYTRTENGVPFTTSGIGARNSDSVFSLLWGLESMLFEIDNDGLVDMQWTGPLTVTETVVEKSAILPFEQIQSVSEKMYPIIYKTRLQGESETKIEINVDRIGLELMRIRQQDITDSRNGIAVPAWVFYGQIKETGTYDWSDGPYTSYQYFNPSGGSDYPIPANIVLCINAVDGSVIDPILGY